MSRKRKRVTVDGAELRNFLMSLDELAQIGQRLERKVRDARVVDVLTDVALPIDVKADLQNEREREGAGRSSARGEARCDDSA